MMAAVCGGAWDVGCWRFQRQWIDQMMAIQVGGSSTGDESELVAGGERFFLSKISQKFALFLSKSSPRL